MKIKIATSLFSVLSLFMFSSTAFATLKVTPDKPADPDIVCKTEADIPLARAQALTRGGGLDFASSAEVLCRAQISANSSSGGNTANYYYTAPTLPKTELSNDDMMKICKSFLDGGQVIDGKCRCPADKLIKQLSEEKFQCVDFPIIHKVETPVATTTPVSPNQLESAQPVATSTSSHATLSKTLKIGSSGVEVKILQSMLGVGPTGYFGAKTREAVIKFQKLNKLPQSGVVGDLTRKALNK